MITSISLGIAAAIVVFLLVRQVANKHKQLPGDKNYSPTTQQKQEENEI